MKIGDDVVYVHETYEKSQYDESYYHNGYDSSHGNLVSFDDKTAAVWTGKRVVFVAVSRVFVGHNMEEARALEDKLDYERFGDSHNWKYERTNIPAPAPPAQ